MAVVFRERQRFRQTWLSIVFLLPLPPIWILLAFALHQQLVLGKPFGNQPASDAELIVIALVATLVPLFFGVLVWSASLETEVSTDAVTFRFRPFHLAPRRFAFHQIAHCEARRYDPLGEFGGWGIRKGWRRGSGWAYKVSGVDGVQLDLHDGRRLLIGSQHAEELEAAIRGGMK
jgi:hypothetical protein